MFVDAECEGIDVALDRRLDSAHGSEANSDGVLERVLLDGEGFLMLDEGREDGQQI